MVAFTTGLLDLLTKKMDYLNKAQTVHAENVANSSTPGYKAMEVQPFSFDNALKQAQMGMTVTDSRHIIPAKFAGANKVATQAKTDAPVDVEEESMKVSQTGMDYQMVTSLYHKITGLFKTALKGSA